MARGHVCEAFSELLVDVGGSSPPWEIHPWAGERDQESEPVGSVPHGLGFHWLSFLSPGSRLDFPQCWAGTSELNYTFLLTLVLQQQQDSELENQV